MRIKKLDGLRGVFSLMIVFFHYPLEYSNLMNFDYFIIRSSYIFVDFFFVLSGFVIALNYTNFRDKNELWIYIKKRFIRLYPLLFFTSTIFLIFNLISNNFLIDLINNSKSNSLIINNYFEDIFFANSTIFLGSGQGLNIPSWSISAEIISYLVYGLISLFFITKTKNIVISFLIFVCLYYYFFEVDFYKNNSEFGFLRSLICFHLGYFVFLLSKKIKNISFLFEYSIPLLLIVILYLINDLEGGVRKFVFGFITPLFFSFSILVLTKTNGLISKFLEYNFIQFLGKISYSVYLTHQLLLVVITRIGFRALNIEITLLNELFIFLSSLLVIIIFSSLTFKMIEKKGSVFLKKKLLK